MFNHYLITRFNLRNPKWDVTKNNEALLTDEWMEHRMELFSNFCLPSVVAQTNKNFTWLLYFDVTTPDRFRRQIEELTSAYNNIRAFFINGMPDFYPQVKKLIEAEATKPYLITSRIDNDDCIHRSFIDEIQKQFNSQEYRAIDVLKGYSLLTNPLMLGKKEHVFNPFISLIEKNTNPKTVWLSDHNMWKKENRITRITDKRLWLSVIHDKNKINEFDGYGDVKWTDLREDFLVSPKIDSRLLTDAVPQSKWQWLSFKNMVYVKWVLANKMLKKSLGIYKLKK